MNKIPLFVAVALIVGCAGVRTTEDLPAVRDFDAARYMGVWHEIARLPKWFEHDLHEVTATYVLDGETLKVTNRGVRDGKEVVSTAVGTFAGAKDVGEFRVSFFRPFYGDYRILWLSSDYDEAIVTSGTRSSLWILARKKDISEVRRDTLVKMARDWGFDTAVLEFPRP